MNNLIFPIFAFGCVITGIVLLGIMQARDFAKAELDSAARSRELAENSKSREVVPGTRVPAMTETLSETARYEPI